MTTNSGRREYECGVTMLSRQSHQAGICGYAVEKTVLNDLPTELLSNILCRLPLMHLLEAAICTCKYWFSIIKDPTFSELQFEQSPKHPGHLYTLCNDSHLYFVDKPLGNTLIGRKLSLDHGRGIVSCCGLVCYSHKEENCVSICNPITGDCVKVTVPPHIPVDFRRCGFGYALLSKKYKYIQFIFELEPKWRTTATIFTLGEESWREVHLHPFDNYAWWSPVYCSGSLYSLVSADGKGADVLSIDLDTEKVRSRRLVLPSSVKIFSPRCEHHLAVLGDNVAFVILHLAVTQISILVDEAEDVWVHKYWIVAEHTVSHKHYDLLGLWMNEDMNFMSKIARQLVSRTGTVYDQTCLSYNASSNVYIPQELPFETKYNKPELVIPHTGSLVSPSKIAAAAKKQPSLVLEVL